MICVTGASGTLSSEVISQLESAKAPLRAAYFSNKGAEAARARGIKAVIIDYNHPETLLAAFQGCDKLFLLGPNALNQTQLELNAVEAAKAAGVRHICEAVRSGSRRRGVQPGEGPSAGRESDRVERLGMDVSPPE